MLKQLEVPYYSQLAKGSEYYINDCLAACFRMVWGWYRLSLGKTNPKEITVNHFSQSIYESTADLGSILDIYKLPFPRTIPYMPVSKSNGITINRIEQELQNDHPVIALILYDKIRPIKSIGHFVVITGYDKHNIVIHDPYYNISEDNEICEPMGYNHPVHKDDFEQALNPGPNPYFSNPYQGLVWNGA